MKKAMTTRFSVTEFLAIGKIILGNLLLGFAYALWMKPNGIINGGVTSIAMILEKITKIPILYLTNGVTIVLLVICLVYLGKANFFKSILSSVCYNLFFAIFYLVELPIQFPLIVGFLCASLFIAIGYYCCISANASTVGMDVIALVLHKKNPDYSIAKTIRFINFIVLGFGLLTYGIKSVVIGIIFSYLNSFLLGTLLKRSKG